ncbi:MAG TPA: antitoxin [Pseudonocardia sp.]|jgi:hypothetical protein
MSLIRRLAAVGAAAEAARRYARSNPDKARQFADKAARFADDKTKGKYSGQIHQAKRKIADLGGFADPAAPVPPPTVVTQVPPSQNTPPAAPQVPPTPYKRS